MTQNYSVNETSEIAIEKKSVNFPDVLKTFRYLISWSRKINLTINYFLQYLKLISYIMSRNKK